MYPGTLITTELKQDMHTLHVLSLPLFFQFGVKNFYFQGILFSNLRDMETLLPTAEML